MAVTVTVQDFEFNDVETGKPVKYKRLCLSGYIGGEIHTLELKLEKSELLVAQMLLSSNEQKPENVTRKANADELKEHSEKISRKEKEATNKNILDDDEDEDWLV